MEGKTVHFFIHSCSIRTLVKMTTPKFLKASKRARGTLRLHSLSELLLKEVSREQLNIFLNTLSPSTINVPAAVLCVSPSPFLRTRCEIYCLKRNVINFSQEIKEGKDKLIEKIKIYRPLVTCFNGKGMVVRMKIFCLRSRSLQS